VEKAVWYYMNGDEKEGPISHSELLEMLDSGKIDLSTKVWTHTQKEWIPISEVEHFNMSTLDETPTIEIEKKVVYSRETDQDYVRTRPWVRFFARMFDYSLFIIVISLIVAYTDVSFGRFSSYMGIIALFLWVFIEALLLSSFGTTPGKWLLKVTVRDENHQKLTFSGSLNRSFSVWWLGMGAGLPIISLVTMLVAAVKLNSSGATTWDRRNDLKVFYGTIGFTRGLIVAIYFLCYAWVFSWGQLQIINQQL